MFLFEVNMISESRSEAMAFQELSKCPFISDTSLFTYTHYETTVPRYTTQILGISISLRNSG